MAYQLLGASFVRLFVNAARSSWTTTAARASLFSISAFNAEEMLSPNATAQLQITNYQQLIAVLKKVAPDLEKEFYKQSRKLGVAPKREVVKKIRGIGPHGPFGRTRRPGRNSDGWDSQNGRISWSVNGKQNRPYDQVKLDTRKRTRNKDLRRLQAGEGGTLGVVRIRVMSAPTIIADIAGASRRYYFNRGKMETDDYQINYFGKGVITRKHKINPMNSIRFVQRLSNRGKGGPAKKASRYAYPAVEKAMPQFKKEFQPVLSSTVTKLNALMR